MDSNELFKEMCIEDETQYKYQQQESSNDMDSNEFNELFKEMCIEDQTQYEYQHQESPNEEYFECEAEYSNGTWCC